MVCDCGLWFVVEEEKAGCFTLCSCLNLCLYDVLGWSVVCNALGWSVVCDALGWSVVCDYSLCLWSVIVVFTGHTRLTFY